MAQQQISAGSINAAIAGLRFFFTVTFAARPRSCSDDREQAAQGAARAERGGSGASPRSHAGLKYKAALSVAYRAGLRVSYVANLKVSDIDNERMMLRVEQGKGQRDRYVMLSPQLLELLRDWWRAARRQVWRDCQEFCVRGHSRASYAEKSVTG